MIKNKEKTAIDTTIDTIDENKENANEIKEDKPKKRKFYKRMSKKQWWSFIILLLANVIFFFSVWFLNQYDDIRPDQLIFHLKAPNDGASKGFAIMSVIWVTFYTVLGTSILTFLYVLFGGHFNTLKKWKRYVKYCGTKICKLISRKALSTAICLLLISITILIIKLKIVPYISISTEKSDFIETHYVDPKAVDIQFPENKRNLIFIFLESMEATYADTSAGEAVEGDLIPELSKLAKDNVNFSHNNGIGGARSFTGTTWTTAAMFSYTSGINIKVPLASENYGGDNSFIPGAYTLGQVLEKQGYNQTLLLGSNAMFGGRKSYFEEHGNYNVVDTVALKEAGRLDKDYNVFWGIEDEKLFAYAKEEINTLYEKGKPFNFTMLTVDTHFPDGYECDDCEKKWTSQYANALSCSSKRVYEFVEWIKAQPFYENTTIVICGDHLTMDSEFMDGVNDDYTRTVYNCFINSAVTPIHSNNRQFGTFDIYPTTLAALGATIKGDKLGLGTNLFSEKETVTEMCGYEKVELELQKKSIFYNEKILQMEDPDFAF